MNGIIVINKPKGWTSNDIVQKVKRIANEKVGHTGTLDPMATGILPILIGNGTKISKYLVNHDKSYTAKIRLGIKTTTADLEGEIIEKKEVSKNLDADLIKDILNEFIGKIEQTPPIYSAIKVKGKKLYDYAREGKNVEIPKRIIEIYKINLLDYSQQTNEITFNVECSKGTYIRTLCEDIAKKLGTVGTMIELNRTKVGIFNIEDSIDIESLNTENITDRIITIEEIFKNKEEIILPESKKQLFYNGVKLNCSNRNDIYRIYINNEFIGLGTVNENYLKRDILVI